MQKMSLYLAVRTLKFSNHIKALVQLSEYVHHGIGVEHMFTGTLETILFVTLVSISQVVRRDIIVLR